VNEEVVVQADVPADALPAKRAQAGRCLRPGRRVGGELDAQVRMHRAQLLVHPHHELHVLTQGRLREASDCAHEVAPKDAESAGDDQQPVQARPGDPRAEERAQVLAHLGGLGAAHGHPRLEDDPVLDHGAVGDPDRAADGDDPIGVRAESLDDPYERVAIERGVGVDTCDQLVAGEVEASVGRVRAAAVLLADDPQSRVLAGDVDVLDRLGLQLEAVSDRQLDEVEGFDQRVRRAVGGAVVDNHDLERLVRGREHRAYARDDHRLLVVGRSDDGDPGAERSGRKIGLKFTPPRSNFCITVSESESPMRQKVTIV
jgi:hypothetical protein